MITEEKRNLVNTVAGQYLAEPEEGDFYSAYLRLKIAQKEGSGFYPAFTVIDLWEGIENITVDQLVDLIEGGVAFVETKIPDFLLNIDWKMLKEQKQVLLATIAHVGEGVIADNLTGLLHLIDSIQDYAVDKMGIKEENVFTLSED